MKKIIVLFFISAFLMKGQLLRAQAALGVPDTLAYIRQIVANKANYIGQPFSALEDSLQIDIKFFSPLPFEMDFSKEKCTSFGFMVPVTMADFAFPRLLIYWQPPYLDYKKASDIYDNEDGGGWVPEADSLYRPGIIKDITISPDIY